MWLCYFFCPFFFFFKLFETSLVPTLGNILPGQAYSRIHSLTSDILSLGSKIIWEGKEEEEPRKAKRGKSGERKKITKIFSC